MINDVFISVLKQAVQSPSLYVMGCFGAPLTEGNKTRYVNNHKYNAQTSRVSKIRGASNKTFGFDCVNLIKGVLWGWMGDLSHTYGGATYCSNGVPDTNSDGLFALCYDRSCDFSFIEPGEMLHMEGHCGVYIGDGLAIECSPKWDDGVQITAVGNIGIRPGYNTRTWVDHGKLPWVDYAETDSERTEPQEDVPDFWAKEAWEWAKVCGLMDGTRPHDNLTRQELAVVLRRISDM